MYSILFSLIFSTKIIQLKATSAIPNNQLQILDKREMWLSVKYITEANTQITDSNYNPTITVLFGGVSRTFPFIKNPEVGRVDVVLDDFVEENLLYITRTSFKLKIDNTRGDSFYTEGNNFMDLSFTMNPNEMQEKVFSRGEIRYIVSLRSICPPKYSGYGCQYIIEETNETIIDAHTGKWVCKDPSNCAKDVFECAESENICINGATCKKTLQNEIKCLCTKGFSGAYCEIKDDEIVEIQLLQFPQNKLDVCLKTIENNDKPKVCNHCKNNECKQYGSFIVCDLYDNNFDPFEVCGNIICRTEINNKVIYFQKSGKSVITRTKIYTDEEIKKIASQANNNQN